MSEVLTKRERDILALISDGLSDREIAKKLHLSFDTVRWYDKQIYHKLGVRNRVHAVSHAYQSGLLDQQSHSGSILTNLPAQVTSFIGRVQAVNDIMQLLNITRLLTITGAGGVGKTRLSLHIAHKLRHKFRHGVFFVELAALTKPDQVPKAIAKAMNIGEISTEPQLTTVIRALKNRESLVIVDNFEHVIQARHMITTLLKQTVHLTLIVTSRKRLHITGEHEYLVPPLSLADKDAEPQHIRETEAVKLFVQRSQMVNFDFEPHDNNILLIADICRRLDGLPLAIELAAAHSKILSPGEVLERLERPLDILTDGHHDLPLRQQTLRNTIEWSYQLLTEKDRAILCRLAVFRNGFTLRAAQMICNTPDSETTLKRLSTFVNANLLYMFNDQLNQIRFAMLETIYVYVKEQLDASREAETIYERMVAYCVNLTEQAEIEFRMNKQLMWFMRVNIELDNIRFALEWAQTHDHFVHAMRMIAALRDFWFYEGFHAEGQQWLQTVQPYVDQAVPELHTRLLMVEGLLAYGRQHDAEPFLKEALNICSNLDDQRCIAWALTFWGFSVEGKPQLYNKGVEATESGLEIFHQLEELPGIAWALNVLGNLKRLQGEYTDASQYYEECIEVCRQTGEQRRIAMVLGNLGIIAEQTGQYDRAMSLLHESIELAIKIEFRYTIPAKLSLMAGVFARKQHYHKATQLLSASLAINESMGLVAQANTQIEIDRYISDLRDNLSAQEFDSCWKQGQNMPLEVAINYATSRENI